MLLEHAAREIAVLEASSAAHLAPLRGLLLRTESVASSKIEQIEADVRDYARALHGSKANAAACCRSPTASAIKSGERSTSWTSWTT